MFTYPCAYALLFATNAPPPLFSFVHPDSNRDSESSQELQEKRGVMLSLHPKPSEFYCLLICLPSIIDYVTMSIVFSIFTFSLINKSCSICVNQKNNFPTFLYSQGGHVNQFCPKKGKMQSPRWNFQESFFSFF